MELEPGQADPLELEMYLQSFGLKFSYGEERVRVAKRLSREGCTLDKLKRVTEQCCSECSCSFENPNNFARGKLWKIIDEPKRWLKAIADLDVVAPKRTTETHEDAAPRGHCIHGRRQDEHCCSCSSAPVCGTCDPEEFRRHVAQQRRVRRASKKEAKPDTEKRKPRVPVTDPLARKKMLWFRRHRIAHELTVDESTELGDWQPTYVVGEDE